LKNERIMIPAWVRPFIPREAQKILKKELYRYNYH